MRARMASCGFFKWTSGTVLEQRTLVRGADAEQRKRQLRAPGVPKARDAEDLALAQFKGNILEKARQAEAFCLQHRLIGEVLRRKELVLKFAAGHIVGELAVIQILGVSGDDQFAAAEDGEALGDLKDLVELVADEKYGDALLLQMQDDLEKRLHFLAGQGRCRLVHDDQARVEHQRAADGDHLLFGDGERADQTVQLHIEVNLRDGLLGDLAHALAVDELVAVGKLCVEGEVFHDREVGEDGKILIDDLNAAGDGVARRYLAKALAGKLDIAGILLIDAGNDLDQRGFAAAVLTGQAVDLAGLYLQRDVFERLYAGKGFADVHSAQQGLGHETYTSVSLPFGSPAGS